MDEKIKRKAFALFGLAKKAGLLSSGKFMVEKSVKGGRSFLVILAEDASELTKKEFTDMCSFYRVPIISFGIMQELGAYTGTSDRAILTVNDEGFAKSIEKLLK